MALRLVASALIERPDIIPTEYLSLLGDAQEQLELTGVEASIRLSYNLVLPELQKAWRLLSVFPGTFDLPGAAAVLQCTVRTAELILSSLVKYSLLEWSSSMGFEAAITVTSPSEEYSVPYHGRYYHHDLVRSFASGFLEEEEWKTSRALHAAHYSFLLSQVEELYQQDAQLALAWFDLEWHNIQAGHNWAIDLSEEDDNAAQLCSTYILVAESLTHVRLHPRLRILWLQAAVEASRRLNNQELEHIHLGQLGNAHYNLGNVSDAVHYLRKTVEYFSLARDKLREARFLSELGTVYTDANAFELALECFERGLMLGRDINDNYIECVCLSNLGNVHLATGSPDKAIEYAERALSMAVDLRERQTRGSILNNLGEAYLAKGEPDRAIDYLKQAFQIFTGLSYVRGQGYALFNMSLALYQLGNRQKAIETARQALEAYEAIEYFAAARVKKQLEQWSSDVMQ